MTTLKHSPEDTIQQIQTLLSEGYGTGFTIFKELLQNADDVGATRLLLEGHDGFPDAENVLLQVPGVFVANDGPVSLANWDGLQKAAGGSKGGQSEAVGRFGLGQKALYHLCDAYTVFARIDGAPQASSMILNPYEEIANAQHAQAWKELSAKDERLLAAWAETAGMGEGLVLRIPLRNPSLRAGSDSRMVLTSAHWTPQEAIKDILYGQQLQAALACLRHLERIEILCPGEKPWHAEVKRGFVRLAGPGDGAQMAMQPAFGGALLIGGVEASVHGKQSNVAGGVADALRQDTDWPTAWTLTGLGKAKATPHGAAIVCRHPAAKGTEPRLRVWDAVYLPLGDPARDSNVLADVPLGGTEHIELVVHGDFFVSSNRASIVQHENATGTDAIKSRWNEHLRREASLPCVLDTLASAIAAMPDNAARFGLVKALRNSEWWPKNAVAICDGRALANVIEGKSERWKIVPAERLRPIPVADSARIRRLEEAWPGFTEWCERNGILLAQGTTLGARQPEWSDGELAAIVEGMGPAAWAASSAAQTLSALLGAHADRHGRLGQNAQESLARTLREAIATEACKAPMLQIKSLTRHLPPERIFVLPKSVISPVLLAHLAAHAPVLCLRAEWLDDDPGAGSAGRTNSLGADDAIALLAALEPLTRRQGKVHGEALSVIGQVLAIGPDLARLAQNGAVGSLKIIPVRRARDRADDLLTPAQARQLVDDGLLFSHGPFDRLDKLAQAVAEPAPHSLRQNIILKLPAGKSLASPSSPSDIAAIISKARRFGEAEACAELFLALRSNLTSQQMRILLAADANLLDEARLAQIESLPAPLMDLVDQLIKSEPGLRILDPVVARHVTPDEAIKARVDKLDISWLGDHLTRRHKSWPLTEGQAEALLASALPRETLAQMALHKVQGEQGLHSPKTLLRGKADDVPQAMRRLVRIVDPYPAKAGERQRELIEDWTPERQIALALGSAQLQEFSAEIFAALEKLASLKGDLAQSLRDTPWLSIDGCPVAPGQIRDILPCALDEWPTETLGAAPPLLASLGEAEQDILIKHALVHSRHDSYRIALQTLANRNFGGLVVDLRQHNGDLRALAKAKRTVDDALWPVLASALRAIEDEGQWQELLARISFPQPDEAALIDQLNSLASLASPEQQGTGRHVSEAARRLWRAGFQAFCPSLREPTGFYPADLLVESEAGPFARADCLALDSNGLERSACLANRWVFERPENHSAPATSSTITSEPLKQRIASLFAPFRKFHELHSAVTLVLALLGRGREIELVARQFHGNPDYAEVCADLDHRCDRMHGRYSPLAQHMAHLHFDIVPLQSGQALVLSAAGLPMRAQSQSEGTLLYGCTRGSKAGHHWHLAMAEIEPRDLAHASAMLREAVKILCEPVGMRMNEQRGAMLALIDLYLSSDQATLDHLVEDIKDGLYGRIKSLNRTGYLKQALTDYDKKLAGSRRDHDDAQARILAKETLWQAIQREEAEGELLEAIREKMHRRNYAPERTLFELFQNAVDAAHQKGEQTDLRVEADRDETGAIVTLRMIHWGRAINVAGGPRTPLRYDADLDNMLDLDSSEKEGEDRGKHGLGFKTCHMLSDDTRVASGRLLFRIRGGMIPLPWEEGRALQQAHNRPDAPATIIELPIAAGRSAEAERAWDQFAMVAEFLPLVAPDIGEVVLVDGAEKHSGKALVRAITATIALVHYGQDKQALRLDLGSGHHLYLRLLGGKPANFATGWSRLWNLAPLDGEKLQVDWIIDGPFEMEQGRRGFHGQADSGLRAMQQRGGALGKRLLELFDQWDAIAPAAGLTEEGRDAFFAELIERMMRDLGDDLARHLHGINGAERCGLAALFAERPVLPLASGKQVSAQEVDGVYRHTLADAEVRKTVEGWPFADAQAKRVDERWASRLERLGFAAPETVDLGTLAERICRYREVDGETAARIGAVFNLSEAWRWHPEERKRVEDAVRTVRLKAQDGQFAEVQELWFAQDPRQNVDGDAERLRAAFMPPAARLHLAYAERAVDFAQLARNIRGYNSKIEREHLKDAYRDHARCKAALVFLAQNPKLIAGLNWLRDEAALLALPAHRDLSPQELATLRAWLGAPAPASPEPEPEPYRDPEDILADIARWWAENRNTLVARHDQRIYAELEELCSVEKLQGEDETAWFTMLSLASFQTLGRITPEQSRGFVQRGVREGWWHDLASVDDEALPKYAERLWAWSEIGADEDFLLWRRCLGDMCLIARNLDAYRTILTALPQMVEQVPHAFSLTELLRPSHSQIVGRMSIDAAPLVRSIGMGANWIVRELARRGFYDAGEAELVQPFAWSARHRIRNFFSLAGIREFSSGVDQGRQIHDEIVEIMGSQAPFGTDGDLPLEILNTRSRGSGFPLARQQILAGIWAGATTTRFLIDA